MIWCIYMSTILSAVAFITASLKSDKTGELVTIGFPLSLVLAAVFLVIGLMTFCVTHPEMYAGDFYEFYKDFVNETSRRSNNNGGENGNSN